ncbi:MAG: hypothetical protein AAB393_17100 [Bacteroidota bacterium]
MNTAVHNLPRSQFRIAHILAATLLIAVVLRVASVRSDLWFGAVHVYLVAAILYIAKWKIVQSQLPWVAAVGSYAVVLVLLLPYVWLRIIYPDCHSPLVACPLLVYSLPTATFLACDMCIHKQTAKVYWTRTCIELLLLAIFLMAWWHYWADNGGITAPGLPW